MAIAGEAPRLVDLAGGDPEAVRGEHVTAAAAEGDGPALEIMSRVRLVGGARVWPTWPTPWIPELIVVGGGLIAAGDVLIEPTRRAFAELVEAPSLAAASGSNQPSSGRGPAPSAPACWPAAEPRNTKGAAGPGPVTSPRGVPPDQRAAALRVRHHQRAARRGPPRRSGRHRHGIRQPGHPEPRRSRSRSWPRRPAIPATTGTRRRGAFPSCAWPSPTCTCAASAWSSTRTPKW